MSNHHRIRDQGGGRIVDRTPPIPQALVTVRGIGNRQVTLHRDAARAYERLLDAAHREAGVTGNVLRVVSGYRDPTIQQRLWQQALRRYGTPQLARQWVAPPGRSAHQTGRALDLYLGVSIGSRQVNRQRQTPVYRWLQNNARRFGFYPYEREPWHWEFNPPRQSLHDIVQRREHEAAQSRLTRLQSLTYTPSSNMGYNPRASMNYNPIRQQKFELPFKQKQLYYKYAYEAGNYFPLYYEPSRKAYYTELNYTRNPKRPFLIMPNAP